MTTLSHSSHQGKNKISYKITALTFTLGLLYSGVITAATPVQNNATGSNALAIGNSSTIPETPATATKPAKPAIPPTKATEENAIAIGNGAEATAENATAIGKGAAAAAKDATAIGDGAAAKLENSIALGNGATVSAEGTAGKGGIAIGKDAYSHSMAGANHEKLIHFGRTPSDMSSGIAIGDYTHARISTIDIGNRDYRGKIGDIDLNGKNNREITSGIGATTVGDNSTNSGNFSTINGAFNLISKTEDKPTASWAGNAFTRGMNALHNAGAAIQGFGSSITGSLNSIEANEELEGNLGALFGGGSPATGLMYSGFASNIIGTANRINKSNGALIFGTANEITNSYLTPKQAVIMDELKTKVGFLNVSLNPSIKEKDRATIKDLADSFRKYGQANLLGAVGVIGGANKVDHALFSNVMGVGNELKTSVDTPIDENNTAVNAADSYPIFSAFNSITGYENKATDVTHSFIGGSYNEISAAEKTVVLGNNQAVKGKTDDKATGNLIIGFNDKNPDGTSKGIIKEAAKNIAVLGNNVKANTDNSVYLGNDTTEASEKEGTTTNADGTTTKTVKATAGMDKYEKADDAWFNYTAFSPSSSTASTGSTTTGSTASTPSPYTFAGATPFGIVSVGSTGKERRIQNVAAGLISKDSTDAINGSQLYAALNMPIGIYESETDKSPTAYTNKDSDKLTGFSLANLTVDFGKGLKAEKVAKDGKPVLLVTADSGAAASDKEVKQIHQHVNRLGDRINKVERNLRAGVAGAHAAAALPQSHTPGVGMFAVGGGHYKGQNALAVGYSRISDNGRVVMKLQGSADSRGDVGVGVGFGFEIRQ